MEIRKLPQAYKEAAALDAKLARGDLSLNDLKSIAEEASQIARRTLGKSGSSEVELRGRTSENFADEKTTALAEGVFHRATEVESALVKRDISLLPALSELDQRVMKLFLAQNEMEPEAIAEELIVLSNQLTGLEDLQPATEEVIERLMSVKSRIEDLIMGFVFPIGLKEFSESVRQAVQGG
jgi:hypothetical protein